MRDLLCQSGKSAQQSSSDQELLTRMRLSLLSLSSDDDQLADYRGQEVEPTKLLLREVHVINSEGSSPCAARVVT